MQGMNFNSRTNSRILCGNKLPQVFVSAFFLFLLSLLLGLLLALFSAPSHALTTNKKVLIIHQQAHGFTQQLIKQLERDIAESGFEIDKMTLKHGHLDLLKIKNHNLIISIGSQATKILLQENIKKPILSALIPRHISISLRTEFPDKKNWSSLLLDQPIERQFNLITAVMGAHKNISTLLGPYTKNLKKALNRASSKTSHNIDIKEIENTDQLTASLKSLNRTTDVLLTLPDPIVYNKTTMRGILLLAYKNKLPVIGFSKSYVKAGALAAIYSKPEQISQQAAHIARIFLANNRFIHEIYYPDEFSVASNKNIARSLGIKLATNEAIIKQIKMAEDKK